MWLLDQRRLPFEERWLACRTVEEVAASIASLAVRGAPCIGLAAAYGLALAAADGAQDGESLSRRVEAAAARLAAARPTAANLRFATDRCLAQFEAALASDPARASVAPLACAQALHDAQADADGRIAEAGVELLEAGDRVLTHCNTGALATGASGTAGGVLLAAWRAGRLREVWVDETRPLLQGARLTTWELQRAGVPFTLVTDSSVGVLMARGLVDRVVVGADRIAANGDVANKIGTYVVATMAARHEVPFYVAAPVSTIDAGTPTGAEIPIEERSPDELRSLAGCATAPPDAPALNLAFDVTPHELVCAIVTERGVLEPPFHAAIGRALS